MRESAINSMSRSHANSDLALLRLLLQIIPANCQLAKAHICGQSLFQSSEEFRSGDCRRAHPFGVRRELLDIQQLISAGLQVGHQIGQPTFDAFDSR